MTKKKNYAKRNCSKLCADFKTLLSEILGRMNGIIFWQKTNHFIIFG